MDLLVCTDADGGPPVGFLLAYRSDHIERAGGFAPESTERRLLALFGGAPPFHVVKQVGVAGGMAGRGIGRALYDAFFRELSVRSAQRGPGGAPPADVFAAVVSQPPNLRSARFHERLGFLPVLSHGAGVGQPPSQTDVWHVTAEAALLRQSARGQAGSRSEGLLAAAEAARGACAREQAAAMGTSALSALCALAVIAGQFALWAAAPAAFDPVRSWLGLSGHAALAALGGALVAASGRARSARARAMAEGLRAMALAECKLQALSPAFRATAAGLPPQPRAAGAGDLARRALSGLLAVAAALGAVGHLAPLLLGA